MHMMTRFAILLSCSSLILISAAPSSADSGSSVGTTKQGAYVKQWKNQQRAAARAVNNPRSHSTPSAKSRTRSEYAYLPKSQYQARMNAYRDKLSAAIAFNKSALNAQGVCLNDPRGIQCASSQQRALPTAPNIRQ